MNINTTREHILSDSISKQILNILEDEEKSLKLESSYLYYDFPVYKDLDENVIISKILIVSPFHGIILIETLSSTTQKNLEKDINQTEFNLEQVYTALRAKGDLRYLRLSL